MTTTRPAVFIVRIAVEHDVRMMILLKLTDSAVSAGSITPGQQNRRLTVATRSIRLNRADQVRITAV